jgi:actin-like ATPase involved in cell morphogenesis
VDLGTTFVAAAICDGDQPEMVGLGRHSVVIPSVVFLDDDGELLCGEDAVRRSVSEPDRSARAFKRRLGDPIPVRLGDRTRPVPELLSALLREVLRVVTESEGATPERVVLTHPANWGPFRQRLFQQVAGQVCPGDIPTVTEPVAAAAHYVAGRGLADGEIIAAYDLGGGTFDVTVLRAVGGRVEILGVPEGIERLGGIDFDDALYEYVDHVSGGALRALNGHDPRTAVALAQVRRDCVLAKEKLSVDTEAVIPVFLPERNLDVRVTRAQFEDLIRAHVESTVGVLERTLRSAHVAPADLDAVLLVGGSSRIPLVARMVSDAIGAPVVLDTHPKYGVALGAAAFGGQTAASVTVPVAFGAQTAASVAPSAAPVPAAPLPAAPAAPVPAAPAVAALVSATPAAPGVARVRHRLPRSALVAASAIVLAGLTLVGLKGPWVASESLLPPALLPEASADLTVPVPQVAPLERSDPPTREFAVRPQQPSRPRLVRAPAVGPARRSAGPQRPVAPSAVSAARPAAAAKESTGTGVPSVGATGEDRQRARLEGGPATGEAPRSPRPQSARPDVPDPQPGRSDQHHTQLW